MKKFLGAAIVVVVAAYGGFKAYVWYEASSAMDQLKAAVAQDAVLEYGWISSSLSGEVRVDDLRLTPFALKDTITIDALSVKVPGAAALIDLTQNLEHKQPPDRLSWRLEGVRMGLSSPLLEEWVADPVSQALGKVACGDVEVLGPQAWQAMGYDQLVTDLNGGYRIDRTDQTLKLTLAAATQAMSKFDLELIFKLPQSTVGFDAQLITHPPQLDYARLSIEDDSYQRRLAHYCSRQAELQEADYLDQSVQAWTRAMAGIGIGVTADLKEAYRLWLEGDKRLLVELDPQRDLDYALLPFIKPAEALDLLGTTVRVDAHPVRDLAVEWNPERLMSALLPTEPAPEPFVRPTKKQEPAKLQRSFQVTEYEQLADYLGYPVRVNTLSGRLYEGKLVSAQELGVEVGALVSGGMITYPVRKADIEQIEVYR